MSIRCTYLAKTAHRIAATVAEKVWGRRLESPRTRRPPNKPRIAQPGSRVRPENVKEGGYPAKPQSRKRREADRGEPGCLPRKNRPTVWRRIKAAFGVG